MKKFDDLFGLYYKLIYLCNTKRNTSSNFTINFFINFNKNY